MYGLCKDTVTVYRGDTTCLLEGCCFQEKTVQKKDLHGTWTEKEFLLIVPGDRPIYPGDQVCREGNVRGIIRTVIPYFRGGKVCHREGRGS